MRIWSRKIVYSINKKLVFKEQQWVVKHQCGQQIWPCLTEGAKPCRNSTVSKNDNLWLGMVTEAGSAVLDSNEPSCLPTRVLPAFHAPFSGNKGSLAISSRRKRHREQTESRLPPQVDGVWNGGALASKTAQIKEPRLFELWKTATSLVGFMSNQHNVRKHMDRSQTRPAFTNLILQQVPIWTSAPLHCLYQSCIDESQTNKSWLKPASVGWRNSSWLDKSTLGIICQEGETCLRGQLNFGSHPCREQGSQERRLLQSLSWITELLL